MAGTIPLRIPTKLRIMVATARLLTLICGSDVAASVVAKGAHQRRSADPHEMDGRCRCSHSSGKSDGQRFREKLKQDVALLRAQRLFYAIVRVRCCTETSMMFISPMPPMPRVSAPIKANNIC